MANDSVSGPRVRPQCRAQTGSTLPSDKPRASESSLAHIGESTRSILARAAVVLLALVVFFFHLGSYGLWEPDEARYAEIAREMLAARDFIMPHLNYVPYIEKPPLLYWLTALAFHFLGVNELAARIVPAVSALGGVLASYWFGRRVFDDRRAILAATILATSPLYAVMAQVLTTDMLLTALLSAAFFALYGQWQEGGRWWLAMYAAAALAVLTKGPVGVILPGAAGLLFLWWQGALRGAIRHFHLVAGAILVAVLTLPWFAVMAERLPGFVQFYFVGEHFRRVFVSTYSHNEPLYFYLPVALLGLMPWSICLPLLPISATPGPARSFCVIAAGVVIALFSAADAKLIPYILPALPPLALLLADSILSALENPFTQWRNWQINCASLVAAIGPVLCAGGAACIVVGLAAPHIHNRDVVMLGQVILAIGAVLIAGGAAATAAFRRGRSQAGLALVATTVALTLVAGRYGRVKVESLHSYAPLSRELALRAPGSTLIDYHRYQQAIAFYTGRRVILAGPFRSELRFGAEHSPERAHYFLDSDAELLSMWAKDPSPVLIIDAADLRHLAPQLGPVRIIAAQGYKLAITKVASPAGQERD